MSTLIKMQFMSFLNSATTNNWAGFNETTISYALQGGKHCFGEM